MRFLGGTVRVQEAAVAVICRHRLYTRLWWGPHHGRASSTTGPDGSRAEFDGHQRPLQLIRSRLGVEVDSPTRPRRSDARKAPQSRRSNAHNNGSRRTTASSSLLAKTGRARAQQMHSFQRYSTLLFLRFLNMNTICLYKSIVSSTQNPNSQNIQTRPDGVLSPPDSSSSPSLETDLCAPRNPHFYQQQSQTPPSSTSRSGALSPSPLLGGADGAAASPPPSPVGPEPGDKETSTSTTSRCESMARMLKANPQLRSSFASWIDGVMLRLSTSLRSW